MGRQWLVRSWRQSIRTSASGNRSAREPCRCIERHCTPDRLTSAHGRRFFPFVTAASCLAPAAGGSPTAIPEPCDGPHGTTHCPPASRRNIGHRGGGRAVPCLRPWRRCAADVAGAGTNHIPCWPLDIGPLLPAPQEDMPAATAAQLPPGAALILHVNAPMLPLVLLRLPRDLTRGRRVIGYWAWELSVLSHDWRGDRLVHEAWVPSRFTAAAIETLLPGRVRVVAHPVAIAPRKAARPDRGTFGLPPDAVIVLASTNLRVVLRPQKSARSDCRLSSRIRGTAGPCAVAEARQPD